jgi:hypothetical protein
MARTSWNRRNDTLSGGQLRFYRRSGTVELASPARLNVSARALGLSCYEVAEVASFDPFVGEVALSEASQRAAARLRDWPEIWAVVVDFGVPAVTFAVGGPQATRASAEHAARRESIELEEFSGIHPDELPESAQDRSTIEELITHGGSWAVLYGPLNQTSLGMFCEADRSSEEDFESAVLSLQRAWAWELTRTSVLALRSLPCLIQRRILAFAFTARALDHS